MRVMTWNVWCRFGDWAAREKGILATLDTVRPDLLGLVESWPDQPRRLAAERGPHAVWVPASRPPAADLGLGLVSRWPIRDVRTPTLPHDQRGGPEPTALRATVEHPRGPLGVLVAGTEWEERFAADHLAHCRALADMAVDARLDLVLGDFNAAPGQAELAPLLRSMVDTWAAGGGDPAAVTLDSRLPIAPTEAVKQLDRRIDHIFARPSPGLVVHRAFLAGDRPFAGTYPSDHYAVVVDLDW